MSKDKREFTSSIRCAYCGNVAPMEIVGGHSQLRTQGDAIDEDNVWSWEEGYIYRLLCCQACHEVVLQRDVYDSRYESEDAPAAFKILYPQQDSLPKVLPTPVRIEYDAASKVKPISSNAYAVLLGRVFDKVCEDRKAKGRTLSERLADLAARGEIPQVLADMAHGLRQLRNVGAHADLGDLTSEEIRLLDAMLRAILEYLYRAPRLVEAVKTILAKRKGSDMERT